MPAKIVLNDFCRQWTDVAEDVLAATRRTGESGWYILGKEVEGFERELAAYSRTRHAVGCANGMDAIEIALRAFGLKAGQRVLTTSLSAFATTLAIVRAGGVPVFADVDAHGLLDLDAARAVLAKDPSIKHMVPVHLFGHALDLGKLDGLRREFGLTIVEDCCQAIGAAFGDQPVGSVGQASALSFYPTKNLGAFGDGGALLTNDDAIAEASQTLRNYGQAVRYQHEVIGLNSRLDELHAAVLRTALLPRLPGWVERRTRIAEAYLAGIRNAGVTVPGAPRGSRSVWHLFPVLVRAAAREAFREHLLSVGVATAIHYPVAISSQNAMRDVPFELPVPLPMTDRYCTSEVSLPIHPYMTDGEVGQVIEAVNRWQVP